MQYTRGFRPGAALLTFALAGAGLAWFPQDGSAQYFGRNKVQYQDFSFSILPTEHFNFYYYPVEAEAIGARYVCLHTASDLTGPVRDTLSGLEKAVAAARTSKVAVAGGITLETADQIIRRKPEILIVGGAIMKQDDKRQAALRFRQRIDQAGRGTG